MEICHCSQELGACDRREALMYLKGPSVGLRPAAKHLHSLRGSWSAQQTDTRLKSSIFSSTLLPGVTAANFKALCTTVISEAAFTLHKTHLSSAWAGASMHTSNVDTQEDLVSASISFLLLLQ